MEDVNRCCTAASSAAAAAAAVAWVADACILPHPPAVALAGAGSAASWFLTKNSRMNLTKVDSCLWREEVALAAFAIRANVCMSAR